MIYITGDTHGDIDMGKLNARNWPIQRHLTRDDYLIVCGDFGGVWYGNRKDNYLLNWHEKKNYTTLWVDGNHENFHALDQYPVGELYLDEVMNKVDYRKWFAGHYHLDTYVSQMRLQELYVDIISLADTDEFPGTE